jgi:hypothetical protein
MAVNSTSSYLSLLQEQVFHNYYLLSYLRDSDYAKQSSEAFKTLEKKYSKRISVNSMNAKLSEDHLLPMLIVTDRSSGEIITQIFNFVNHFPNN